MNDRYQILSTLAAGGRGTVFRAFDTSQNRDVALKRLHANGAGKEDLLREARRLYGIRHPNLITVLDYGEDEEGAYLVMEMLKGENLEHRLTKGPLPLDEFRELVRQTLAGIGAAHEAGLLHRDLKSDNILVLWDVHNAFRIKIVDFGLAQPLAPGGTPNESAAGSVHTMAPELFAGGLVDARTDLYALGVIYYQALTGRMPFDGDNRALVAAAHLQHALTPLSEHRPDLSTALCDWIESLLSQDPAGRPTDAATALARFEKLSLEDRPLTAAEVVEEAVPMIAIAEPADAEPAHVEIAALTTPLVAASDSAPMLTVSDTAPLLAASETAPLAAPADTAPLLSPADTAPLLSPAESAPRVRATHHDEPPAPSRPTPPRAREPKQRRSALQIIIVAFVVMLIAQFAFISWYKHSKREERATRFAELAALDHPAGSDLDTRLLLEFLDDPTTQDAAAATLSRLQGGDYIDRLVLEHLDKARNFPACEKLIQVIGQRRHRPAFATVLGFIEDARGPVRQAAWTALGTLAAPADLPRVLAAVPKASQRDHEAVGKGLVAAVQNADDRRAATQAVIAAWQAAPGDSPHRALLFNVLTRVGGTDTLAIITQAIADPSEQVRRAAITLLAEYPSHDPLPAIAARFPAEADDTCRTYLLIAAIELVGRPGPLSQQALFAHGQELWNQTRDSAERRYVLSLLGRIFTSETAAFFERYAETLQGAQRREARQLAKAFRDKLADIIPLAPGGETTVLPADRAEYRLGAKLTHRDGALVDWSDVSDWAAWLVELPAPGKYEILIHQAHEGTATGTYEVQLGEQILPAAVVDTGGEFKGFILGEIEISAAGTHKVFLRPRQLPTSGELFRVQKLSLKPAG